MAGGAQVLHAAEGDEVVAGAAPDIDVFEQNGGESFVQVHVSRAAIVAARDAAVRAEVHGAGPDGVAGVPGPLGGRGEYHFVVVPVDLAGAGRVAYRCERSGDKSVSLVAAEGVGDHGVEVDAAVGGDPELLQGGVDARAVLRIYAEGEVVLALAEAFAGDLVGKAGGAGEAGPGAAEVVGAEEADEGCGGAGAVLGGDIQGAGPGQDGLGRTRRVRSPGGRSAGVGS